MAGALPSCAASKASLSRSWTVRLRYLRMSSRFVSLFFVGKFWTRLSAPRYCRVFRLVSHSPSRTVPIASVLQFPPRASERIFVSGDSS